MTADTDLWVWFERCREVKVCLVAKVLISLSCRVQQLCMHSMSDSDCADIKLML